MVNLPHVIINRLTPTLSHSGTYSQEDGFNPIDKLYSTYVGKYRIPTLSLLNQGVQRRNSSIQIGDVYIDSLLCNHSSGGIHFPLVKSTLIYGPFGTGKTLFSIQASICFLKKHPDGLVAFFTTDGPFPSNRLFQLDESKLNPSLFDRFFIFEIRNIAEFISFILYFLPSWKTQPSTEKFIVVDNLTSLLRFSDDLDEITIGLPRAVHFGKLKLNCTFLFVSQVKSIIDDSCIDEARNDMKLPKKKFLPAIHSLLFLHGHFFDLKVQLDAPFMDKVKELTCSTSILEPRFSVQYTIHESKGITTFKPPTI